MAAASTADGNKRGGGASLHLQGGGRWRVTEGTCVEVAKPVSTGSITQMVRG